MSLRHLNRLRTALLMVLTLLFSQLALAHYVCPQQADLAVMTAMLEAGTPCDELDPQQPALCHQHAADPGRNVEAVKLPVVAQPAVAQILQLPPTPGAAAACAVPLTATAEGQPPPDPLFLSTLRLRV